MCTVAAENDHRAHWGACILRNSPILYRKHVVLYIDVDGTLDFFCRPVNFDIAFRYDDPFRLFLEFIEYEIFFSIKEKCYDGPDCIRGYAFGRFPHAGRYVCARKESC
jgi:hypothetical protein